MPRKKLIRTAEFPYHITTRTNNKEWFNLRLDQVWEITQDALLLALEKNPATIHAFVLMHNHYHLIITTPHADIDRFMRTFNKFISDSINLKTEFRNRKFSGPYHWSVVDRPSYFFNVYRYVYRNPVKAGLSQICEDYPYSSLFYQVRGLKTRVPYHVELDGELTSWLYFFNRHTKKEDEYLKRGLSKSRLRLAKDTATKKEFILEGFKAS